MPDLMKWEEVVDMIEGVIYKLPDGVWVALFHVDDGRNLRCQVDYCPWCGMKLEKDTKGHTH